MAQQQTKSSQISTIRSRSGLILVAVALIYVVLAARLVYLQVIKHAYFQKQADAYRVSKSLLPARRGLLLDRNGEPLAINVPAWAIYADPLEIKDVPGTAARLAPLLDMDPAKLQTLLTPRSKKDHYRDLKRRASDTVGTSVKALKLQGIGVVGDTRRAYPNDDLASQVLGFTNTDGVGIEGMEHSEESLLRGQDGRIVGEVDNRGRFLPGTLRHQTEPVNGHDIVLTLDKQLQHTADARLDQAVQEHHAEKGVVVIMDPQTGDILALSSSPDYNPNMPRPKRKLTKEEGIAWASRWRDVAVSDLYEPGSTLKTITASAVLQEQGLGMMDKYVFCSGHLQVGRYVIHEAPDALTAHLGSQNLRGILRVSSNVGMAQFGLNLGAKRLFKYEQAFGFLDYPGSGLPGEEHSYLSSPDERKWADIRLANVAFGQGISITPLQLATAYCAVANGGTLMRPHIIKTVRASSGAETPVAPEPIRRVLDPAVAAAVRSMLGTVVEDGTGKPAQIAGFSVGGKTGSAQVAGRHGYESGHYVASFVGLYPLSHPRLVILCAIFEPQGIHWGATVAAPVVHDIAKQAVLQLHLAPDAPNVVDWDDHLKTKQDRQQVARLTVSSAPPSSGAPPP